MDYSDNMQEDTSSNTILTDDEFNLIMQTGGTLNDYWRAIAQEQDAKTTRLLIEELESYLQKWDDYRLVITKMRWESFKKSKGVSK